MEALRFKKVKKEVWEYLASIGRDGPHGIVDDGSFNVEHAYFANFISGYRHQDCTCSTFDGLQSFDLCNLCPDFLVNTNLFRVVQISRVDQRDRAVFGG